MFMTCRSIWGWKQRWFRVVYEWNHDRTQERFVKAWTAELAIQAARKSILVSRYCGWDDFPMEPTGIKVERLSWVRDRSNYEVPALQIIIDRSLRPARHKLSSANVGT